MHLASLLTWHAHIVRSTIEFLVTFCFQETLFYAHKKNQVLRATLTKVMFLLTLKIYCSGSMFEGVPASQISNSTSIALNQISIPKFYSLQMFPLVGNEINFSHITRCHFVVTLRRGEKMPRPGNIL